MSSSPFFVLNLSDERNEYDETLNKLTADTEKSINLNSIKHIADERISAAKRSVQKALSEISSSSEMIQVLRKDSCCSDVISDDALLEVFKDCLKD